jgi:hypothetical protein
MTRLALLTFLVAATAVVTAAALAGGEGRQASAPGPDLAQLEDVSFVAVCRFSHRASDDPIVFPGQPDRSHDHTFFGNAATDAFSTPETLRGRPTTCHRAEDTAAYWAPTLLLDGETVLPEDAEVYYHRRTVARVRPFPPDLVMIGGSATPPGPQSTRIVHWDCGDTVRVGPSQTVPTCPSDGGGKSLRLTVRFPDCWDGRRLDSPDHASHMAYSSRGVCPASHRVAVPSIRLVVQYPVAGGPGVELASRGQLSGHADFVNTWEQAGLRRLVEFCLNGLRVCGKAN